jgi:hypothetical protein
MRSSRLACVPSLARLGKGHPWQLAARRGPGLMMNGAGWCGWSAEE